MGDAVRKTGDMNTLSTGNTLEVRSAFALTKRGKAFRFGIIFPDRGICIDSFFTTTTILSYGNYYSKEIAVA